MSAIEELGNYLLTNGLTATTQPTVYGRILRLLNNGGPMVIEDLFVLLFKIRDVRGIYGGRRDITYNLIEFLVQQDQTRQITLELLDLLPHYGCWRDLFNLSACMLPRVKHIVCQQFQRDELALQQRAGGDPDANISMLAKWMPREGDPDYVTYLVSLVPGTMFHGTRAKLYRKRVSALNKAIGTLEVKMCANKWHTIEPDDIPNLAREKYAKALRRHHVDITGQQHAPYNNSTRYDLVRSRVRRFYGIT